jgi:hypothetical protein
MDPKQLPDADEATTSQPAARPRKLSTRNLGVGVVSLVSVGLGVAGTAQALLPNRHEYWPPTTGSQGNNYKCTDAGYVHSGPARTGIHSISNYGRGTSRCGSGPGGGWARVGIQNFARSPISGTVKTAPYSSSPIRTFFSGAGGTTVYAAVSLPSSINHHHHELQGVSRRS